MSDRRPTSVKPIANPAVQEMLTQMMFGDGPMAALIRLNVFAGRTHPKYLHLIQWILVSYAPDVLTLILALDMWPI